MGLIEKLICTHWFKFVRNIYGDEIIRRNYKRSQWECEKCGHVEFRDELVNPDQVRGERG